MPILALAMVTFVAHVVLGSIGKFDGICRRDSPLRSQATFEAETFPVLLMPECASEPNLLLVEGAFRQHTQTGVARIKVPSRVVVGQ